MTELNVVVLLFGGLTLTLSLISGLLKERLYVVTDPLVATLFGVVIGPVGLGMVVLPAGWERLVVVEQTARVTVALAVTSIALRLPDSYVRRRARSLAVLLVPGMTAMWLLSGLSAYLAVGVAVPTAMLIGAVVTPTDPVIANTIVTGRLAEENIPSRVRRLISGESGANDGLAAPFVHLGILTVLYPPSAALAEWVPSTFVQELAIPIAVGVAVGASAGIVERWTSEREITDETSVLTVTVALTFAVLGAVTVLGGGGILGVFVAALAYSRFADPSDEAHEQQVTEVFNRLFSFPVFVLFGMEIPWARWTALGWRGPALVVAVLLARRLPMVLALGPAIHPLDTLRSRLFAGWFGPVGIAALYYATLAARETGVEIVWVAGSLVVAGSLLAHGVTATPLTLLYGRHDADAQ
ncbi:cation:proton antiporter domain-containing protein [Natronoarchaeum philippinense]|nr:cation:proton antiporter [Natronoarchaeum philippinense]